MYRLVATPVFKLSLQRFEQFLTQKYSAKKALKTKQQIKQTLDQYLPDNPFIAPISGRLLELGISQYRQYAIDDNNLVFYQVDDTNKRIVLLLIMDARQDIQKLLYELTLLVQVS